MPCVWNAAFVHDMYKCFLRKELLHKGQSFLQGHALSTPLQGPLSESCHLNASQACCE